MPRSAGHSTSSRSDGDICTGSLVFGERHPGPSRTDLMSAGLVCCMQDNIFFARFRAIEPFPDGRVPPGTEDDKLKSLLAATVDVPLIMNTMAEAIKKMVIASARAPK